MDTLQKVQLRQSELRSKLTELIDTPTETRGESFADDLARITSQVRGHRGRGPGRTLGRS